MTSLREHLYEEMARFRIIDAHEHLGPESERVKRPVSVFTLFRHYTQTDLKAAGMSDQQYEFIQEEEHPLEERWKVFAPFYEHIRHTGYTRAARIVARDFYGIDDINESTYGELSDRLSADNTPGLYDRVLRERCNIEVCLTQCGRHDLEDDVLVPLLPVPSWQLHGRREIEKLGEERGVKVTDPGSCIALGEALLDFWKSQGVVGLKMTSRAITNPSRQEAEEAFGVLWKTGKPPQGSPAWQDYLHHRMLEAAGERDLPVAVHTGIIWNNWNDFTEIHPRNLIPLLQAHRNTRFDCYHAGIPWVGTVGVMGKTFPNLWLNLCWCHVISPEMTVRALSEWLDLVPANKIIAFGGDYAIPVEKTYGHLVMARENIARVLAARIEQGVMNEEEAVDLARRWFYDNPVTLYRLAEPRPSEAGPRPA